MIFQWRCEEHWEKHWVLAEWTWEAAKPSQSKPRTIEHLEMIQWEVWYKTSYFSIKFRQFISIIHSRFPVNTCIEIMGMWACDSYFAMIKIKQYLIVGITESVCGAEVKVSDTWVTWGWVLPGKLCHAYINISHRIPNFSQWMYSLTFRHFLISFFKKFMCILFVQSNEFHYVIFIQVYNVIWSLLFFYYPLLSPFISHCSSPLSQININGYIILHILMPHFALFICWRTSWLNLWLCKCEQPTDMQTPLLYISLGSFSWVSRDCPAESHISSNFQVFH